MERKKHKGGVRQHQNELEKKKYAESNDNHSKTTCFNDEFEDPGDGNPKKKQCRSSNSKIEFDPNEEHVPTHEDMERYKKYLKSTFIQNKVSAKDFQENAELSSAAGAQCVAPFAKIGKTGELPGNLARDLKVKIQQDSTMPKPYFAQIPTHCPDTGLHLEPLMYQVSEGSD